MNRPAEVSVGAAEAEHMLHALGGGIGRLPNGRRNRIAELVDSWPSEATP